MPRYEYRCRTCGVSFELARPMSEASAPCLCPEGHADTVKLLSTVSVAGMATTVQASAGCCGGACGCAN